MTDTPAFYEERIRLLEAERQQAQEEIALLRKQIDHVSALALDTKILQDKLQQAQEEAESRRRAWFTAEQRFQQAEEQRQQAVEALRRIEWWKSSEGQSVHQIARAALAQLGETP